MHLFGRRRALATAAAAVLGLAGCLGDDDADPGFEIDGDFELPTEPAEGDFVDWTGRNEVKIETTQRTDHDPQFVFDPPFVRVDQGTAIQWVNGDGVFHTVTSTESLGGRSPSGTFNETISSEGDSFEWAAESSGRQAYFCSPHVGFMYGALEIE